MVREKPVIAITPLYDEERESIWMLPGYHDMLLEFDLIPVDMPFGTSRTDMKQLMNSCHGLLLTGGQDVNPSIYKQPRTDRCGDPFAARDNLDRVLLNIAMARDIPVLGICRGIQLINAHLGGTLFQDLPTQHPSTINHHMRPPYDRPQHKVHVLPNTPLANVVGENAWAVNSYHHQAIRKLAPCLAPMAISEDGIIEAVYHPNKAFLWAVQWHPEYSFKSDERQRRMIGSFADAVYGQKPTTRQSRWS